MTVLLLESLSSSNNERELLVRNNELTIPAMSTSDLWDTGKKRSWLWGDKHEDEEAVLEVDKMVVDITHCNAGKIKLNNERMRVEGLNW